jgi:hypothetical protein
MEVRVLKKNEHKWANELENSNRISNKKVICSFSTPVPAPGFKLGTLSTNNKRAKPLDHAAALIF